MPGFTTDDGVRLHFAALGNGPVDIVCLHWMGGEGGMWNAVAEGLDLTRYRLVALDTRGHGQSQREPCAFTLERIAKDVVNLADELSMDRFAIAGHSFGGKVALRLATLAPGRISALALVGAVGPGRVPLERPMVEEILGRVDDAGFIREVFRPWFQAWPRTGVDAALATFTQTPVWALRAVCEAALWTDITAEVAGITAPALVIAGANDPVYGPVYQEQAVCPFVPPTELVTISGCGHGLILERPNEIAGQLDRFIRRLA